MKKALLPIAILAALPAVAMADVTIYGRANVSVDLLDDGDDYSEVVMSSNSSRLGFRANREFEGFTAMVQIEQEIDFSDSGTNWASRDTFVGLRGGFGMFRLGKFDTPFKQARGPANLFGDQIGDMRNFTRAGDGRFDERTPNTIHYQTPDFSGFRFNVAYSLHEGRDSRALDDQAISLSLTYTAGALDLAAAYEKFDDDATRGGRDAFRFAIAYKINDLTLVGFYQTIDHNNDAFSADVFGIGASFAFDEKNSVKAQVFNRSADPSDSDSTMFAVGYEYRLARPVRLMLAYARVTNDDNARLAPWVQARTTDRPGSFGNTASGFSMALRYDF
ncbi:MAG: porin [Wenzhouxiangella sp.]